MKQLLVCICGYPDFSIALRSYQNWLEHFVDEPEEKLPIPITSSRQYLISPAAEVSSLPSGFLQSEGIEQEGTSYGFKDGLGHIVSQRAGINSAFSSIR